MTAANGTPASGRWVEYAAAPVRRSSVTGMPKPTAHDLLVDRRAGLLDGLDDRRHQRRLVEPERTAPDAVADGEIGADDAREELGAAEVDPDDAARLRTGRRHGGCHHTHRGWRTRNPSTRSTAAARGCSRSAKATTRWPSCARPRRSRTTAPRRPPRRASGPPTLPGAAARAQAEATRASASAPGASCAGSSLALVGWVVLSGVLFMVSAQIQRGDLADEVGPQLSDGPYPLTGANTILVLGSDARTGDLAEPGSRRPEPLGLDHAAADRRRRQRLALDPARHGRRHPRPRDEQDQRRLRVRRPGARDPDRQGVPRRRDQPRRRGQLRELPAS